MLPKSRKLISNLIYSHDQYLELRKKKQQEDCERNDYLHHIFVGVLRTACFLTKTKGATIYDHFAYEK